MKKPTTAQLRMAGTVLQALLPLVPGGSVVKAASVLVNGGMKLLDVRTVLASHGATPAQLAALDAENDVSVIDAIRKRGGSI